MAEAAPPVPARLLLPLLVLLLLVGLEGPQAAGGEEAPAPKSTSVLWMETESAFNQQTRPKRRPHCLIGVLQRKYHHCHLHLWVRKWKPRGVVFLHHPCTVLFLHKQLKWYVQIHWCRRALALHKSLAQPTAPVVQDGGLRMAEGTWPKWPSAHCSPSKAQDGQSFKWVALPKNGCPIFPIQVWPKLLHLWGGCEITCVMEAGNPRWWPPGRRTRRRYPRTALDRRSSLGAAPLPSATPGPHLERTDASRPLGPSEGTLLNVTPSFGHPSRPSVPAETGTTPPAKCQCPGGERGKAEGVQQKALKGPPAGRRVPTPRTEEAAWAASALTFLLVVLTLAVLYTQLHRKCRRSRSLYWATSSEEGHDTVAAVIKHRLLSAQARRKKRSRTQQRMLLLPTTSSESSE